LVSNMEVQTWGSTFNILANNGFVIGRRLSSRLLTDFIYLRVLTFPLEDCSEFDNFVVTLICYIVHLFKSGSSHSTIKCSIFGLKFFIGGWNIYREPSPSTTPSHLKYFNYESKCQKHFCVTH
jgi:hypothetical protein